jgi:hypothetical protein
MNSANISTKTPGAAALLDTQQILGDIEGVKTSALKTLQQTFRLMGTVKNNNTSASEIVKSDGLPELEEPINLRNVNDITLRIGLLQDALNQLMAKVSKQEIQQRMNESQKENQKQLEKFKDQMAKAAEAAEKNKEAQKKGNVFEAISNWIQAVVSIVSAIVTMVSAVGQILTNPVGAAGLIVASLALLGTAAVQITLAIDATMRAAGQDGFLSDTQKANMAKAAEIMGYIAIAGSLIGLVGGVVVALGQAGKAAAGIAGREVTKMAATKMVGEGMRDAAKEALKKGGSEAAKEASKMAIKEASVEVVEQAARRAAVDAFKTAMKQMQGMLGKAGLFAALGRSGSDIVSGVGADKVADLHDEASSLMKEADDAEAAAKAIQALINKLQALIDQLQQELETLMEDAQQALAVIFGAIEKGAESMSRVNHMTPA